MSDASRWWAFDLALVVVLADVAGAAIYLGAPAPIRVPLAVLLVLLLPGYALTAALFPARNPKGVELQDVDDAEGGLLHPLPTDYELGGAERLALSVALSVAVVPAVAAVVSFTPRGLTLGPVLGGVLSVTVGLAVVAFVRRLLLPRDRRYGLGPGAFVGLPRPFRAGSRLRGSSRRVRRFNLAATVGLVLLLSSVAFAVAAPPQPETFTEFYVVTDDATGSTSSPYPASFQTGESRPVTLAIGNHEGEEAHYTVLAAMTAPGDDGGATTVVGRAEVTVADGETRQVDVPVQPRRTGEDRRLVFLLYRGAPPEGPTVGSAYRVLDLSVDVGGGAAGTGGDG